MGNLLGIIVIGVAIGFSIFVIYKLISQGLKDRNRDDQEQKTGGSGGSTAGNKPDNRIK